MTLTIRRAYEKERSGAGVFRRGRVAGVPVELYHELDNLFRQIEGLRILAGANASAVLQALNAGDLTRPEGSPPPTGTQTPTEPITFIERKEVFLNLTGSAAANSNSTVYGQALPFVIKSFSVIVESSTGVAVTAAPFLQLQPYTGGTFADILVASANQSTSFQHLLSRFYNGSVVEGNQPSPKRFAPSNIRIRITGASPAARVAGSIVIDEEVTIIP